MSVVALGPHIGSARDLFAIFHDVAQLNAVSERDLLPAVYLRGVAMGRVHLYLLDQDTLEFVREKGTFLGGADAMRLRFEGGRLTARWMAPPDPGTNQRAEVVALSLGADPRELRVELGPYEARRIYVGSVYPPATTLDRLAATEAARATDDDARIEAARVQAVRDSYAKASAAKATNERAWADGSHHYQRTLDRELDALRAQPGVISVTFAFPIVSVAVAPAAFSGTALAAARRLEVFLHIEHNYPLDKQTEVEVAADRMLVHPYISPWLVGQGQHLTGPEHPGGMLPSLAWALRLLRQAALGAGPAQTDQLM